MPPDTCGANWNPHLLHYSVVFAVLALVAAAFGLGSSTAAGVAGLLGLAFALLSLLNLMAGVLRRR